MSKTPHVSSSIPHQPTIPPMPPKTSQPASLSHTIQILENEIACVIRAKCCDRNCESCDLVKDDKEIIQAYKHALDILNTLNKYI